MPPLISVVIPTYNRPLQLESCLAALAWTTVPRDHYEVIVVDDGGTAALESIVERYAALLPVTLTRQPNGGPASARNTGASLARGALLAFTDDDCLPDPVWLASLARHAAKSPGTLIGGRTVNAVGANPFSAASQHLVSYLSECGPGRPGEPRWLRFFASNNFAVPASLFASMGGFDVSFPLAAGEDREFCDRWTSLELPTAFAPDAVVWHGHDLNLRTFWRQHWNYGRGAFHFHAARTRRGDGSFRPEPASFYINLVRYPLRHEPLLRGAVHASLLGVAQVANALGYFSERRRQRAAPATVPAAGESVAVAGESVAVASESAAVASESAAVAGGSAAVAGESVAGPVVSSGVDS